MASGGVGRLIRVDWMVWPVGGGGLPSAPLSLLTSYMAAGLDAMLLRF